MASPPPAFSGDELESTADFADNQRLDDAVLADGLDQSRKLFFIKPFSGLERAGNDLGKRDMTHALPCHRVGVKLVAPPVTFLPHRHGARSADEGVQAPAQTFFVQHHG